MPNYHPRVRKNATVQVAGYIWTHPILADYIGEQVEVHFSPVYPENPAHVILPIPEPNHFEMKLFITEGLATVHEINRAIRQSESGKGGYVIGQRRDGAMTRISKSRTKGGALQVYSLAEGHWFEPKLVTTTGRESVATLIRADGTQEELTIPTDPEQALSVLQKAVGGYIELIYTRDGAVLIGNEEGRLVQSPIVNAEATRVLQSWCNVPVVDLVGDIVLCTFAEAGLD